MADNDNRLLGADFVRAGACMIVLLHHLGQRVDHDSALGREPWQVFSNGGGLGVGIFFVLSGFLLSLPFWRALDAGTALPSLRVYALRRAARILPGFWLTLTLTFILSFTLFGATLDQWLWIRFFAGFFLVSDWHWLTLFPVEVNAPLWSIGFEITAYAILPLGFVALALLGRPLPAIIKRVAWLAIIALALGAHMAFSHFVEVDPINKGWEYGLQGGAKTWMPWFNPFSFFAMFALGALVGGVQTFVARWHHWVFDLVFVAALVAAGQYMWDLASDEQGEFFGWLRVPYAFPTMHLIVGFALATGPSSLLAGRLFDNSVVRYIARISFGIYVWHYLLIELARELFVPKLVYGQMTDPGLFWLTALGIVGASVLIADLSYRWLEAPIMAWARRFERRPIATAPQPA